MSEFLISILNRSVIDGVQYEKGSCHFATMGVNSYCLLDGTLLPKASARIVNNLEVVHFRQDGKNLTETAGSLLYKRPRPASIYIL